MRVFRYITEVFDDWLTRGAAIIFALIVALVIFNIYSDISEEYPLFGAINYAMVPVLFIAGGVIFVLAILRFSKKDEDFNNEGVLSKGDDADETSQAA